LEVIQSLDSQTRPVLLALSRIVVFFRLLVLDQVGGDLRVYQAVGPGRGEEALVAVGREALRSTPSCGERGSQSGASAEVADHQELHRICRYEKYSGTPLAFHGYEVKPEVRYQILKVRF
jgi:hypothetical protein